MGKDPSTRPTMSEVANLTALLSGKADEINAAPYAPSKPRLAYLNSIQQFLPGQDQSAVSIVPEITTRAETSPDEIDPEVQAARAAKIEAAAKAAQNRKKNQWKVPVAIGGALVALSLLLGISAYIANQTVVQKPVDPDPKNQTNEVPENVKGEKTPNTNLVSLPPELRPTVLQEIIADDDTSLWESPTNGPPIQFSYLPATPRLLFVFRLSEMLQQAEGQRLLRSFGPEFGSQIESFKNRSGLDLENIEELVVSLHTNTEFEYEPYFVVQTTKPIDADRMIQNWNRPALRQLENQQEIYESKDGSTAYYVLVDGARNNAENNSSDGDDQEDGDELDDSASGEPPTDDSASEQITRFAFGSKQLVEQVALSAGANVLSGSLRKMADWTDRNRHLNVLFLRNALFNDEGQKLMGANLRTFNRELGIAIPDDVRGGLLSLHLDGGNYLELMLDKNIDLKANDLKQHMVDESRTRRDMLINFVASIPSSPYWDKVRIRYGGMLANFYQNLRWDVEHGEVVANCWLPPMAAHNLIASSELVLSFSSGASSAAVSPTQSGPKTLEELLTIKRDLNIANPPDLNVLMSDLKAEIEDDLGKMPFAFNIRLLGSDLEAKGITKNQRPSELSFRQKSLAEILTFIMTSANPAKDISGPSDPNCELVWVVAEDPESPGEKAILITTRTAATEKSYELPEAFRAE